MFCSGDICIAPLLTASQNFIAFFACNNSEISDFKVGTKKEKSFGIGIFLVPENHSFFCLLEDRLECVIFAVLLY